MTDPRIGAVVLAGGRSARFGRDKLAEPVDGRPLLDAAIDAVRVVAADIVVVCAPGVARPVGSRARLVHDARPFEGPLAGLEAGLEAFGPDVERVIVVGGDMPSLEPAVLARLLASLDGGDLAVLDDGSGALPLPAAVRPAPAAHAARALLDAGERRLRALATVLSTVTLDPADWRRLDPAGATLRDVDVPADLG